MKKYVKPEVVETKDYAEGVYLASGGSTDNSLRAAGREIRRFRARSLRAKQILPDVSTADR